MGKLNNQNPYSEKRLWIAGIATTLYWVWEARAGGNIRIDLLLIYPLLFISYQMALWPRFKFRSILLSVAIMALNIGFMIASYKVFGKNTG